MKSMYWLIGLFGSERSVKEMKPLCFERGGNFCTEKSNKEKNNSDKGEFNINVSYRTNGISKEIKETFKGAAVDWEFWGYAFSQPQFVFVLLIAILNSVVLLISIMNYKIILGLLSQ